MALRLVIIDDNETFLAASAKWLGRDGVEVVGTANNPDAGLEMICTQQPDMVVVDIELGVYSGFELARRIACLPDAPRVLMTSSHAQADVGELVERSTASGFLTKSRLTAAEIERCHRHSK